MKMSQIRHNVRDNAIIKKANLKIIGATFAGGINTKKEFAHGINTKEKVADSIKPNKMIEVPIMLGIMLFRK
jgi:hypothetical protein